MKQADLKALCREYVDGNISDADLLTGVQVSEETKTLLWGVTALPMSARLRIRIEDLVLAEPEPKIRPATSRDQHEVRNDTSTNKFWRRMRAVLGQDFNGVGALDGTVIKSYLTLERQVMYVIQTSGKFIAEAIKLRFREYADESDEHLIACDANHAVTVPHRVMVIAQCVPPIDLVEFTTMPLMATEEIQGLIEKYVKDSNGIHPGFSAPDLKAVANDSGVYVIYRFSNYVLGSMFYNALRSRFVDAAGDCGVLVKARHNKNTFVSVPVFMLAETGLCV